MLERFSGPYLILLMRAAWNIQQNLVGIGYWSTDAVQFDRHGSILQAGWNPTASMLPLLGFLSVLVFGSFFLLVLTGYVLGRRRGAFIVVVILLLPGLLSTAGLWPTISPVPEAFDVSGIGIIGDVLGTLTLIVLAVVAGWIMAILMSDCFHLGRCFWNTFEHVWLLSGLVVVLFFIVDANVAEHDQAYFESERDTQRASAHLLKQVDSYDQWCRETSRDELLSCHWADRVHQTLLNSSFESANLFGDFGPETSEQLYGLFGQTARPNEKLAIRTEIATYNQAMCPVRKVRLGNANWERSESSPHCEETPAIFLRAWPEPMKGSVDESRPELPVALDSEYLIPTLVYLHQRDVFLAGRSKSEHRNKNYRWMYYLFFSSGLGVKLAGSTVKLVSLDGREDGEKRRSLQVLHRIADGSFRMLGSLFGNLAQLLKQTVERLF